MSSIIWWCRTWFTSFRYEHVYTTAETWLDTMQGRCTCPIPKYQCSIFSNLKCNTFGDDDFHANRPFQMWHAGPAPATQKNTFPIFLTCCAFGSALYFSCSAGLSGCPFWPLAAKSLNLNTCGFYRSHKVSTALIHHSSHTGASLSK